MRLDGVGEARVLILTRKVGESVLIGDGIKVSVLAVKGNQVRVGIDAPKDVSVHREEVRERLEEGKNRLGTRTGFSSALRWGMADSSRPVILQAASMESDR